MSARKWPAADLLDPPIRELVWALNRMPAVMTQGSCSGHQNPTQYQRPFGHWEISFVIDETPAGWDSLERLVWMAAKLDGYATLTPWFDGGIRFEIDGICDPQACVDLLKVSKDPGNRMP